MAKRKLSVLAEMYTKLFGTFGPQKWWPAQTQFEIIVGAILTQNTNWANVEKALTNLKRNNSLSLKAFQKIPRTKLAALIKPAGYFNVKSKRLKNLIAFLFKEYEGKLRKMGREDHFVLRKKLLAVNGIGPETADSILLYAFGKPVFVIDAYTKRVLYRHNFIERNEDYHSVQALFEKSLKQNVQTYNEYHALFVRLGKDYCKTKPLCEQCVLKDFHYSLTNKCAICHRALRKDHGRKVFKDQSICFNCKKK